jgi:hypothetical protein
MKRIGLAGMMVVLLASCERKEEPRSSDPTAAVGTQGIAAGGDGPPEGDAGEAKPGKTAERPTLVKKKPPVAEPVADKPGYVKSPFSGKIIDVRGIPAGTLVADPTFPASEKKHFRVPELSPEDQEILARETAPEGKPVPGKPGFIFSPYDNKIIDATGLPPGQVIVDPTGPPDQPRYIKVPSDPVKILDPTNLIDPSPPASEEEP